MYDVLYDEIHQIHTLVNYNKVHEINENISIMINFLAMNS